MIAVPYISQWDADAHLSRGDCGIVAACMVARWKGIDTTPDAMLQRAGLPVGRHSYDFREIIRAAAAVGLKLEYRSAATWEVIANDLKVGQPVITLLRYGQISGNQDDFDGAHFWVETGLDAQGSVTVNDPDWWQPRRAEGCQRRVPVAEFEAAIGDALLATGNQPHQSLFLTT